MIYVLNLKQKKNLFPRNLPSNLRSRSFNQWWIWSSGFLFNLPKTITSFYLQVDRIPNRRYEAIAVNIIFVRTKKLLNVKKVEFQKLIILISNSHWLYETYLQFHWVLEDRQEYVSFTDRRRLLQTDNTNSSYNVVFPFNKDSFPSYEFETHVNYIWWKKYFLKQFFSPFNKRSKWKYTGKSLNQLCTLIPTNIYIIYVM